MGNAGACAACCHDIKKAPILQMLEEAAQEAAVPMASFRQAPPSRADLGPVPAAVLAATVTTPASTLLAASLPRAAEAIDSQSTDAGVTITTDRASSVMPSDAGSSAAATDSTAASITPDVGQAQLVVKRFVRSLVKGQEVSVLAVNGGVAECVASLDRKLTTLSLQRSGKKDSKKRGIPLEDVVEICVGDAAREDVELALDEMCVTLMLEGGNAVGFRFSDAEARDTFALCLSMFVDGRRGEVQKKRKEKVAKIRAT